jgi:3,4-dihydroxy 2-butanone 4-phosphate synthase/GTP cyclohydrolase II
MRHATRLDDRSPVSSCSMDQPIGMTDWKFPAEDPEIQTIKPRVRRVGEALLPTDHGEFRCLAFESDGVHHLALVMGTVALQEQVLVRVHSECLTGDIFGSRRCDCGRQLDDAMRRIADEGRGAVIYLRGHEGRGIGIGPKLQAYRLQELGRDTVDANLELGFPVDIREYGAAAAILAELDVWSVRLLTNNPAKCAGLVGYGVQIAGREPLVTAPTPENLRYLRTKRARLNHRLDGLEGLDDAAVMT